MMCAALHSESSERTIEQKNPVRTSSFDDVRCKTYIPSTIASSRDDAKSKNMHSINHPSTIHSKTPSNDFKRKCHPSMAWGRCFNTYIPSLWYLNHFQRGHGGLSSINKVTETRNQIPTHLPLQRSASCTAVQSLQGLFRLWTTHYCHSLTKMSELTTWREPH